MVYVTGDTHGDLSHLKGAKLKKGDTLIVCGDFGFVWYGDKRDDRALAALSRKKYTILFVDGVHENYDLLDRLPQESRFGGTVSKVKDNVFRLHRGEVYTIEGKTWFALGGGEDPLEEGLRAKHHSYYESGMPSEEEMLCGIRSLSAVDWRVDYVVTHTPSLKAGAFVRGRTRRENENGVSVYLGALEEKLTYTRWFFGSLHLDRKVSGKHTAVYRAIIPAE